MTDELKPLTDDDLAAVEALVARGALAHEAATATGVTYERLVAEVRRLRQIVRETTGVVLAELEDALGPEGVASEDLRELHPADLVRRLAREIPKE